MLVRILLFILFSVSIRPVAAQLTYQLPGARAAGMGDAAVALPDLWALQHNIGALAEVQHPQIAVAYQTRMNLPELSTAGIMGAFPLRLGVLGGSFTRYGFGPYSQQEASLGYAHKIHIVALGIQAGLVQVATKGLGSQMTPLLSFGGVAELHPKLRFGGYAYNVTQSRLNKELEEYLPTVLRAGLLWTPTRTLRLALETEKDVDLPARLKTGIEYQLRPFLLLRTGVSTAPVVLHGGLGLWRQQFRFDYALQHHQYLGLLHHLTFGWQWNKK